MASSIESLIEAESSLSTIIPGKHIHKRHLKDVTIIHMIFKNRLKWYFKFPWGTHFVKTKMYFKNLPKLAKKKKKKCATCWNNMGLFV